MSSCRQCKFYGVLHSPWKIETTCVHGFCFKDFKEGRWVTYPVYIPDGGKCKCFIAKPIIKNEYDYEMTQEFRCECCKKDLIDKISKCIEKGGKT